MNDSLPTGLDSTLPVRISRSARRFASFRMAVGLLCAALAGARSANAADLEEEVCEDFGGVWSTAPDECEVSDFQLLLGDSLTIPPGVALLVEGASSTAGTLLVKGELTNDGDLTNDGRRSDDGNEKNDGGLFVNGKLNNNGTLDNNGELSVSGELDNNGTLENSGTLTNGNEAQLTNDSRLVNVGTFLNLGASPQLGIVTNNGLFDNGINNSTGNAPGRLSNAGLLSNNGTLTNLLRSTLTNGAVLNNVGVLRNESFFLTPPPPASSPDIGGWSSSAAITNSGGGRIENAGDFTLSADATLLQNTASTFFNADRGNLVSLGSFANTDGSTLTNEGTITTDPSSARFSNVGSTFTNEPGASFSAAFATLSNVSDDANGQPRVGRILNQGTFRGGAIFTNDKGSVLVNAALAEMEVRLLTNEPRARVTNNGQMRAITIQNRGLFENVRSLVITFIFANDCVSGFPPGPTLRNTGVIAGFVANFTGLIVDTGTIDPPVIATDACI